MGNYTKNGLMCIIIGMIISVIASSILFLTEGAISIDYFSGLLSLAGIILMIVGRKEFGEKHSKFVIYALVLFIISFIVTLIFVVMIALAIYSAATSSSFSFAELSPLKNIFLMVPIVAVIGGFFNIFLVYELEDRNGKNILFLAFVVTVIVSFYIAIVGAQITDEWVNSFNQEQQADSSYLSSYSTSDIEEKINDLQKDISKIGAIGIIGQLIYLIAFIIPYRRIKSGELSPVLADNLKRCMNCGRVGPSDSAICAYCGKQFTDSSTDSSIYNQRYYNY